VELAAAALALHEPSMFSLEEIKSRLEAAIPTARLEIVANPSPSGQHSLRVDRDSAVAVARLLRDHAELRFDYCSNVTGVDWLAAEWTEKVKIKQPVEGGEQEIEATRTARRPAHLEVVYHLYSMEHRQGPLILRLCTGDRTADSHLPSLTPIWRSCEFQEREVFDLFGVHFDGHPDLRRIFMWDEFKDFPMRKDYVEPDDYEYEPTPHDEVLAKARKHQLPEAPT